MDKGSQNFREMDKGSENFWPFPGKDSDRVSGLKNDPPLKYQIRHILALKSDVFIPFFAPNYPKTALFFVPIEKVSVGLTVICVLSLFGISKTIESRKRQKRGPNKL